MENRIKKVMADIFNIDVNSITDDSHFVNDLGADSLNIVEVVMGIEQEFDIEIPDDDAETLLTVGQVKQYIEDNS